MALNPPELKIRQRKKSERRILTEIAFNPLNPVFQLPTFQYSPDDPRAIRYPLSGNLRENPR